MAFPSRKKRPSNGPCVLAAFDRPVDGPGSPAVCSSPETCKRGEAEHNPDGGARLSGRSHTISGRPGCRGGRATGTHGIALHTARPGHFGQTCPGRTPFPCSRGHRPAPRRSAGFSATVLPPTCHNQPFKPMDPHPNAYMTNSCSMLRFSGQVVRPKKSPLSNEGGAGRLPRRAPKAGLVTDRLDFLRDVPARCGRIGSARNTPWSVKRTLYLNRPAGGPTGSR